MNKTSRMLVEAIRKRTPDASTAAMAAEIGISQRRVQQILADQHFSEAPIKDLTRHRAVCPSCSLRKSPRSERCSRCVSADARTARTCPNCGRAKKRTSRRCRNCSRQRRRDMTDRLGNHITLTCGICKGPFHRRTAEVLKRRNRGSSIHVCSTRCRAKNAARARRNRRKA